MKKLLIFLFSILISFNSYGKTDCDDLDDGMGSDGLIYVRGVQLTEGNRSYLMGQLKTVAVANNTSAFYLAYSCSWDDNVRIEYAGYYVDGELIDLEYSLYDSGTIEKAGNYKDGKQDGKWIWWYENGQKQAEGNFIDGKSDGKWIWWNKNGQKVRQKNYKNGKLDGKLIEWFQFNSEIKREENYKNGMICFNEC